MAYQTILTDNREGVLHLTLNRPEKLNALTPQLLEELLDALHQAQTDPDVGPIVIKGAGRAFCSGWDITPSADRSAAGEKSIRADIDEMAGRSGRWSELWNLNKPIIAQVHGYCLGGGTDLAMHCDLIIAAEDAQFGYPAVRSMGTPASHMWTYMVGPQWAKRLLLTGDSVDGKTAERIGLVLKAVPADRLEDEVQAVAGNMAKVPYDLLVANKAICNKAIDLMGRTLLQQLALEGDAIAHRSPAAIEFSRMAKRQGLKAALADRDRKFEG
ncbi:MAG: crotonase/enoyl-CoA hydratase family protein [Dehalococcoidia bacterium]